MVGLQFLTLSCKCCKFSLFWARGCDKVAIQAEMQNAVVGRRSVGASRSAFASSSASSSHSASSTSTSSSAYSATVLPALAFWLLLRSPTLLKSPTLLLIYQKPRFKFGQQHLPRDREGNLFIANEKRGRSFLLNQGSFNQSFTVEGPLRSWLPLPQLASKVSPAWPGLSPVFLVRLGRPQKKHWV